MVCQGSRGGRSLQRSRVVRVFVWLSAPLSSSPPGSGTKPFAGLGLVMPFMQAQAHAHSRMLPLCLAWAFLRLVPHFCIVQAYTYTVACFSSVCHAHSCSHFPFHLRCAGVQEGPCGGALVGRGRGAAGSGSSRTWAHASSLMGPCRRASASTTRPLGSTPNTRCVPLPRLDQSHGLPLTLRWEGSMDEGGLAGGPRLPLELRSPHGQG